MSQQRPAGRTAFALNATVSFALLGLIAAVALVVKPAAPPGIAEFAPQAAKPITKAPLAQSSVNGQGVGSCAPGAVCGDAAKKAAAQAKAQSVAQVIKGVPSALQCYTWPDGSITQTFDPQSPPCVASWPEAAKGNGGATSPGLTGSTIRVAVPAKPKDKSSIPVLKPVVDFINSHFQLYGRKIQLVPFESQQEAAAVDLDNENPTAQHADAVTAVSLKTFAALDWLDKQDFVAPLPSYVDYLADHKVISLFGAHVLAGIERDQMKAHAPYQWSYSATLTDTMNATAGLVCRQLKDKLASHAPQFQTAKRKFAIVVPDDATLGAPLPGLVTMKARLAACGLGDVKVYYDPKFNRQASNATNMADAQTKGYTSLISILWYSGTSVGDPQSEATNANYHPEWISMSRNSWWSASWALLGGNQEDTTFGVAPWNRLLPLAAQPWFQAYLAGGGPSAPGYQIDAGAPLYRELMMLASGAQMAGPRLTPETFAAAMHSTTFPNPGARVAPSYQGEVGFPDDDTTMMTDFQAYWDDPTGTKPQYLADNNTNNPYEFYCYQNMGARFTELTWPSEDTFYRGKCR